MEMRLFGVRRTRGVCVCVCLHTVCSHISFGDSNQRYCDSVAVRRALFPCFFVFSLKIESSASLTDAIVSCNFSLFAALVCLPHVVAR